MVICLTGSEKKGFTDGQQTDGWMTDARMTTDSSAVHE